MKRNRFILFALLSLFAIQIFANNDYTLKLKYSDLRFDPIDGQTTLTEVIGSQTLDGYAIVQFYDIPTAADKAIIETQGVILLEYIPNYAFIAKISNPSNTTLGNLNIRSITPYQLDYKYADRLRAKENPDWAVQGSGKIDLTLDIQLDQSYDIVKSELVALGAEIIEESYYQDYLNIRVNQSKVQSIIAKPFTKFLDYVPAPPEKEDTRGRSLHRGNKLDSDHALGRKYDGTGVSIAIADDGLVGPHIDIKGRVTQFASTDRGTHGDMTTGIAMGAGNLDPTIKGMATGAYLYYYDIGGYPHIGNAVSNYTTRGVVVTSTSYSQGCNNYESTARGIDQQVRLNPNILHVFSAGNSSAANCGYGAGTLWGTITGGRKQGKSVIATGNLDYRGVLTTSSSRGPAEDGRIKPDICANGTNQLSTDPNNAYRPGGGTSAAAPSIAGLAAQLYHGYRDLNNGSDPESGLIKASMLNTARDLGNRGPDYFYGWGRVNAHRAMRLLEDSRYTSSTVTQGNTNSHNFTIGSNVAQLRAMVYWTDYEGSTVASRALVNDLDMRLVTPNGDTIRPWKLNPTPNASSLNSPATRGIDNLNNVEQVTIDTVPAGSYTVLVNGRAVPQGPQKYFVLWEDIKDSIEVTYPSGGESFVPGESETIRWDAHGNGGTFTVQYSPDSGVTWNTIGVISGASRYINWSVPNSVNSGDVLVRVSRSGKTGISQYPFSVMPQPSNFGAAYICPDSVRLRWNAVPNATGYVVYMLGATHMDSIGYTDTTHFDIYNLNLSNDNWVSVKAVGNGIESRRRDAIQLPQQALNCPLAYDVNITQIRAPDIDILPACNVGKLGVTIVVNNAGDSVLTNIPMKLYANGTVYNDTIAGPLAPNGFQFFTFRDSINVTVGQKVVSTVVDLQTDANPTNDSLSTSFFVVNGVTNSIPYAFDFETFNNCATTTNCGGTTCSLNSGWFNLPNGTTDDMDMRVHNGSTASNNTGPTMDHNPGTSTGKYIYSEASGGCTGATSYVLTPCFDLTNTSQPEFSFWYHMQGSQMGIIRLDVLVEGVWINNIMTPIFGNQGTSWRQQTVNLSAHAGKVVNLRFRFRTGSGFESDMAIDDVALRDLAVGIDESQKNLAFNIYPNPSDGTFNLVSTESMNNSARVFDLQGRMIKQLRLNGTRTVLDLSMVEKGIYFLDIEGTERRQKLIVY